jgi:hypothetical protein
MAAGKAHEINNPLAVVAGLAELLLRGELAETQRDDILQIQQEANRAGEIVRTLLRFSREREPSLQPLDPATVLAEALRLRAHRLQQYHVTVNHRTAPLPQVLADQDQLLQVLLNLINNAIDAMAPAGGGTLTASAQPHQNGVELQIADTGPGIADAALGRIFDPFFTTKPIGQGTGLGLSISHQIVNQHHGEIIAANRPEGGASFRVILPPADSALAEAASPVADALLPAGGGRVVVLHPDPATAAALAEAVRLTGREPLTLAADGAWPADVGAVLAQPGALNAARRATVRLAARVQLIALGAPAADDAHRWDAVLPLRPTLADLEHVLAIATPPAGDEGLH